MPEEKDFRVFLEGKKLPICVLDQKWHKVFSLKGKPTQIAAYEQKLDACLQRQGKLNQELKECKKQKAKLMESVMSHMDGTHEENVGRLSSKRLDEDKRQLDEVNERIEAYEDELMELPREINRLNKELMLLTVEYCYEKLRLNVAEIREVTDWITQMRIDLKKNIIKKQNREVNSRQIYAYMHGIFGADMMDVFDLDNDDIDLSVLEPPKKKQESEQAAQPDGQKQELLGSVTVKGEAPASPKKKENFDA